jgi:TPR repeat protein
VLGLRCWSIVKRLGVVAALCLSLSCAFPVWASVQAGHDAYERGDYAAAHEAWKEAALAGNPDAQYALGALYSRGQGVKRDQEQANRWYLVAAKAGQVEAQYRIGMRYRTGDGLPKDYVSAYTWLRIAARNGHVKAASALKRVKKKLSSEQITFAERSRRHEPRVPTDSPLSEKRALTRQIQTHLLLLGFDTGAIDGFAGGLTVKALRSFQRKVGIKADGRMTAQALVALKQALSEDRGTGVSRSN